jgi:ribonuclease Z
MQLLFVGTSSCIPDVGGDTACLLINGKHLVDTGWQCALRLRELEADPLQVESVVFTHLHHDHYLGLPQFLFYQAMRRRWGEAAPPLRIVGPGEHLARVVGLCWHLLQVDRFPELRFPVEVVPLTGGDHYKLGDVRLEARAAKHVSGERRPEPALSYRFTDAATGACVVCSGDTSYDPGLGTWARGADLLVHDAAHTTAAEAAQVAKAAGAGRLLLIHAGRGDGERLLADARAVFPETDLAPEGERVEV